jgi:hypothetical protein
MADRGKSRLGALALLAVVAAPSPAAFAGDWTIVAVTSNELNIAENRALRAKSLGTSIGLISTSSLDFSYAMPDGKFSLSGDLTSERYFGEASEDGKDGYFPHVGFEWTKKSKLDTLTLTGDYQISNVTLDKSLDAILPVPTGLTIPVGATQSTYSAGFTWSHLIDRRNTLAWNSKYTHTEYTGDEFVVAGVTDNAGIDNTVFSNVLSWTRKANRRTDLKFSSGVDWYRLDDASGTDRFVYSTDAEITRRLSSRLTAVVGGGVQMIQTVVPAQTEYATDYKLRAGLEYLLKRGSISWNADYGVSQGALGDLIKQASSSLSFKHQINDRSSFNAQANVTLSESEFGGGLGSNYVFRFSPTYNLALTDEWDLATGARFIYQSDQFDTMSSTVFVSLTREFNILR